MPPFDYADAPVPVRSGIADAHRAFWQRMAGPGARFTGEQRVAMAREARAARAVRTEPPWLRGLPEPEPGVLPVEAIRAIRTLSLDQHEIDRDWANGMIESLADDVAYVELVAIAVQTIAVDTFAEAIGVEPEPLPEPVAGAPDGTRPEGLGDIGAFVPATLEFSGPNVARALSLAPAENATFFGLVASMYAMADFGELVWKDRPLTRPQVELVAARVSAINECFY